MPSASTESSDKKGVPDATNAMKQVITIVEKKVRNLEKRKNKLDLIKKKAESGDDLQADQEIAVAKYEEVVQSLEYSKELQKQFLAIQTEATKMLKKQQRKEKLDRHQHELERVQELLKVQNLLDNLGSDNIRADFQTGKHGAVVLTEENLNQLDSLYQLISPTREGEGNYHEKLSAAGEHIVSLLDRRNKEVVGVGATYRELKEIIDLIGGCGYFEAVEQLKDDEVKRSEDSDTGAVASQQESVAEIVSSEDDKTESQPAQQPVDYPVSQAPADSLNQVGPAQMNNMPPNANTGFYAADVFEPRSQRPIDEIVSAVQGNFDFLQESTIDVETAPHNDPAVVAAQPMARSTIAQPPRETDTHPHSGFVGQTFERSTDSVPNQQGNMSSNNLSHQHTEQVRYNTQDLPISQQNYNSSQSFHQNALSQNHDNLFTGDNQSHGMMNQASQDNSIGQFEIQQTIPMPQGQDSQQSNISNQAEKKFTMNASAPVFQSQYSQYSQQQQSEMSDTGASHIAQNSDQHGTGYQGNVYQNDGFHQRGPRREGGGFRGRGGTASGNGPTNSNIQNGFRNGGGQNSGRGGRGAYQGYPSRNNYQSDSYQGYNNGGGNFNPGYKQRGGNSQGPMRGMRGGSQRGSAGGNSGPRGGSRGGYNRPQTQYQQ